MGGGVAFAMPRELDIEDCPRNSITFVIQNIRNIRSFLTDRAQWVRVVQCGEKLLAEFLKGRFSVHSRS